MENLHLNPEEITEKFVAAGTKKADSPAYKLLLLGILAGAFIAFASEGSNTAVHTIKSVGIAKTLAGALFSTGLMMVIITGAELFTGNTLIIVSCLERKTRLVRMLRNWFFVYMGNFTGAMLIVIFVYLSGQYDFSGGLLGGYTVKIAVYKVGMTFTNAFFMGILCNWLVCMAVWMSYGAKDFTGKLLAIFFPVWLFITSGFEHSIANMYYIPAGIIAKSNRLWVEQAILSGVPEKGIEGLTWGAFLVKNMIPVTLGNIIGGALFVGTIYWISFLYKGKKAGNADKSAKAEFLSEMINH